MKLLDDLIKLFPIDPFFVLLVGALFCAYALRRNQRAVLGSLAVAAFAAALMALRVIMAGVSGWRVP